MTVLVSDEQDDPIPMQSLSDLVGIVMEAEGLERDTVIDLTFVGEAAMTELNQTHMNKTGSTDVLSFPIEEAQQGIPPRRDPAGPPVHLGDVFVCPRVVAANATKTDVSFSDELALVVVHGVLHLLGYDHVDDADPELMEGRERSILQQVGRVRP